MNQKTVAGLCAVSLVAGAIVGWSLRVPPPTVEPGAVVAPVRAAPIPRLPPPPEAPDCPPCEVQIQAEEPVQTVDWSTHDADMAPVPGEDPVPWPEGLPEDLQPEAMVATLEEMAEDCGVGDRLMGVDCDEPPCLAVFLVPKDEDSVNFSRCYGDRFDPGSTHLGDSVLCKDGKAYGLEMTGPYFEEARPQSDPDDRWAGYRRLQARKEAWGRALGCTEPAYLTVRNRLGHELAWTPRQPE